MAVPPGPFHPTRAGTARATHAGFSSTTAFTLNLTSPTKGTRRSHTLPTCNSGRRSVRGFKRAAAAQGRGCTSRRKRHEPPPAGQQACREPGRFFPGGRLPDGVPCTRSHAGAEPVDAGCGHGALEHHRPERVAGAVPCRRAGRGRIARCRSARPGPSSPQASGSHSAAGLVGLQPAANRAALSASRRLRGQPGQPAGPPRSRAAGAGRTWLGGGMPPKSRRGRRGVTLLARRSSARLRSRPRLLGRCRTAPGAGPPA
jgi:hypothetical protein